MQQTLIFQAQLTRQKTASKATRFSFDVADIDSIFPGFKAGDFAVIYGPQGVTSLVSQLCVRAQLDGEKGGLDSKVVFIDAASSSSLGTILESAGFHDLDQETVSGNLVSMRAYTAYRLTSLIMEKLEEAVEESGAKIAVISDIAGPFLNGNVDDQEAKAVYSQIMSYLAGFAKKHQIIIIATYLSHEGSTRNSALQEISNAKANTVLRFTKTPYTSEVELEKHPTYMTGVAEFNPEITKLSALAMPTLSYKIL
jgi:RecA/RadA recombinase